VLLLLWGAGPGVDIGDEATWRAASPHWSKERRDLIARKYAAALAGQDEPEFDDPDPVRGWAAQYLNVWPLLLGHGDDVVMPNWGSCSTTERSWWGGCAWGGCGSGSCLDLGGLLFDGPGAARGRGECGP
jgi:hypothetical protein